MKLGVYTAVLHDRPLSEALETIAALGLGAAEIDSADLVLDLGHQHPSAHGALRLALVLDGDRIVRAEHLVVESSLRRLRAWGARRTLLWHWDRRYRPEPAAVHVR